MIFNATHNINFVTLNKFLVNCTKLVKRNQNLVIEQCVLKGFNNCCFLEQTQCLVIDEMFYILKNKL